MTDPAIRAQTLIDRFLVGDLEADNAANLLRNIVKKNGLKLGIAADDSLLKKEIDDLRQRNSAYYDEIQWLRGYEPYDFESVTVAKIAEMARAPENTVRSWIKAGKLPKPNAKGLISKHLVRNIVADYRKYGRAEGIYPNFSQMRQADWREEQELLTNRVFDLEEENEALKARLSAAEAIIEAVMPWRINNG